MNRLVHELRSADLVVDRDAIFRSCVFEALVTGGKSRVAMDVLTFALPRRLDWREAGHDAANFCSDS